MIIEIIFVTLLSLTAGFTQMSIKSTIAKISKKILSAGFDKNLPSCAKALDDVNMGKEIL